MNQSNNGSELTTNSQNATCGELTYANEPICYITNPGSWTCLKTKALSMNATKCSKLRGNPITINHTNKPLCQYVEICAFTDPDFSCDGDYNCTVPDNGVMNCTKDDDKFFTKNCTPSLLHCEVRNFSMLDPQFLTDMENCKSFYTVLPTVFKRQCLASYENYSENHSVWYYVLLSHYNKKSESYSMLRSIHLPDWPRNASRLCSDSKNSDESEIDNKFTAIGTVVTVCVIASIGIAYAVYEGRMKWNKQMQDLKTRVERFWAVFIASADAVIPKAEDTVSPENCDNIDDINIMVPLVPDQVDVASNTPPLCSTQCQEITEACGFSNGLGSKPDVFRSQYTFMGWPDENNSSCGTPTIKEQRLPILINPCYVAKCHGPSKSLHEISLTSCGIFNIEHESTTDNEKLEPYISKNADDKQDD